MSEDPLVESVSITGLFGQRNYHLDVPSTGGSSGRLMLIHGDNGSGKTTVLKLIWNALSSANSRGHRTYIGDTPFKAMEIRLSGRRSIQITKTAGLVGEYELRVIQPGIADVVVQYEQTPGRGIRPAPPRETKSSKLSTSARAARRDSDFRELEVRLLLEQQLYRNRVDASLAGSWEVDSWEEDYLGFLKREVQDPLYLADDRSLYSDDEQIHRTRDLISRRGGEWERASSDRLSSLVFLELQVTMSRVNDYLRSLTFGGQSSASVNTNNIYRELLKQLAMTPEHTPAGAATHQETEDLLREIRELSPRYEEFGLVAKVDADDFASLLRTIGRTDRRDLADSVLVPYLSSLKARYEALQEAEELLRALVPTINGFFRDKALTFNPGNGLQIYASDGNVLPVESLSSGERQLLMLLCTTLLARVDTRLFIIDEPELSLGVEWQRNILDALLGLTRNSPVQFLVATHSIEIISGHPESLVLLGER